MAKQSYKNNVITPVGRISYPFLVEKLSTYIDGQLIERWGMDLIFPKDTDLSALNKIVKDLIKEQWPKATPELVKKIRMPFKDGNENVTKEGILKPGYENMIYAPIHNKKHAPLLKNAKGEILTADEGREEFYGGCYGRALVNIGTYDHMGNKGVKFYLAAVQKHRDGEPLSDGKTTSAQVDHLMEAFDDQEGATDNSDLLS